MHKMPLPRETALPSSPRVTRSAFLRTIKAEPALSHAHQSVTLD